MFLTRFIKSLPRRILVVLVILGSVAYVLLSQPPHSVCSAQMEAFKSHEKHFLYDLKKVFPDKKSEKDSKEQVSSLLVSKEGDSFEQDDEKDKSSIDFNSLQKVKGFLGVSRFRCQRSQNVGSCYAFFADLQKLLGRVKLVDRQCQEPLYQDPEVEKHLSESIFLLARLAWGDALPNSVHKRVGWLDVASIDIFCRLRSAYVKHYPAASWERLIRKAHKEFPEAHSMDLKDALPRMLFSQNCPTRF